MAINFKKLKSQIIPHCDTRGKGWMFTTTVEQDDKGVFKIFTTGSKRYLISSLVELINYDIEFKNEFTY